MPSNHRNNYNRAQTQRIPTPFHRRERDALRNDNHRRSHRPSRLGDPSRTPWIRRHSYQQRESESTSSREPTNSGSNHRYRSHRHQFHTNDDSVAECLLFYSRADEPRTPEARRKPAAAANPRNSSSNQGRDIDDILNFSSLSLQSSTAESPARDAAVNQSRNESPVSSNSSSSALPRSTPARRNVLGPSAARPRRRPVYRSRRRHFYQHRRAAMTRRNPLSSSSSSSSRRGAVLNRSSRPRRTASRSLRSAPSWREERAAMNIGRRVKLQRRCAPEVANYANRGKEEGNGSMGFTIRLESPCSPYLGFMFVLQFDKLFRAETRFRRHQNHNSSLRAAATMYEKLLWMIFRVQLNSSEVRKQVQFVVQDHCLTYPYSNPIMFCVAAQRMDDGSRATVGSNSSEPQDTFGYNEVIADDPMQIDEVGDKTLLFNATLGMFW